MSRLKLLTVLTREVSTSRAACTPAVFKIFEVLGYECELQPFYRSGWDGVAQLAWQSCKANLRGQRSILQHLTDGAFDFAHFSTVFLSVQ